MQQLVGEVICQNILFFVPRWDLARASHPLLANQHRKSPWKTSKPEKTLNVFAKGSYKMFQTFINQPYQNRHMDWVH